MDNSDFKTGAIKPFECLKEAWQLIKPHYLILFAAFFVGAVIAGISLYILIGAMMCGIYLCFLRAIDGEEISFDNLFKGFSFFWQSLPVAILFVVPMLILFGVIYAPLIMASIMGSRLSEEELLGLLFGSLAIDTVVAIVMVCLHTLLMFSFPLIVDRKLSGWGAIKLSAKAVWQNMSGVAGLWGVMFLVNLLGLLVFCVGIYLTIPLILATQLVAYRKVFPNLNPKAAFNEPPMPEVYKI